MSQGWYWSPELLAGGHRATETRDRRGGLLQTRPLAFGYEFGTHDGDVARGFDSKTHLSAIQTHDSDTDIVANIQFFHQFSRQHQHGTFPL